MKKLLIIAALGVAILGGIFIPDRASAQEANEERITLSPAIARPELAAGQKAKGKLTIINDGTVPYTFLLYARPFSVSNEAYEPNYTEVNERTEAYQWVEFARTKISLKAGQRVEVSYTVTVPDDAAPGGHYSVLFAETQPPEEDSSVARKKRVGSLLYMTIAGDIIEKGSLASWDVETLQTKQPVSSSIRVENTGNVHFQSDISVTYTSIFGKKQYENNQQVLVLPGTTRRVVFDWDSAPYFGIYKASGTVSLLDGTEELEQQWIILFPTSLMRILAGLAAAGFLWFVVKPQAQKRRTTHKKK